MGLVEVLNYLLLWLVDCEQVDQLGDLSLCLLVLVRFRLLYCFESGLCTVFVYFHGLRLNSFLIDPVVHHDRLDQIPKRPSVDLLSLGSIQLVIIFTVWAAQSLVLKDLLVDGLILSLLRVHSQGLES